MQCLLYQSWFQLVTIDEIFYFSEMISKKI